MIYSRRVQDMATSSRLEDVCAPLLHVRDTLSKFCDGCRRGQIESLWHKCNARALRRELGES
jgi:hypothetical protein